MYVATFEDCSMQALLYISSNVCSQDIGLQAGMHSFSQLSTSKVCHKHVLTTSQGCASMCIRDAGSKVIANVIVVDMSTLCAMSVITVHLVGCT